MILDKRTRATPKFSNDPSTFVKTLTSREMTEQRAKGLCYNCDELYAQTQSMQKAFLVGNKGQ